MFGINYIESTLIYLASRWFHQKSAPKSWSREKKTSAMRIWSLSQSKPSREHNEPMILLIEDIQHQFIDTSSHYLQGFMHCRYFSPWVLNHQTVSMMPDHPKKHRNLHVHVNMKRPWMLRWPVPCGNALWSQRLDMLLFFFTKDCTHRIHVWYIYLHLL